MVPVGLLKLVITATEFSLAVSAQTVTKGTSYTGGILLHHIAN